MYINRFDILSAQSSIYVSFCAPYIGKDCQVISGVHGSFMAMDIAVDDYSRGQNTTTWIRVRSNKDNHIHLSEYLTKGRLILVDGTLSSSLWKDKNGESQIQLSITAESIAFINTGKREDAAAGADNDVNGADSVPVPPADFPQDEKEDLPF